MHKKPKDFPGLLRELEQLFMVQSGLFFAGPQADHFIMTFANEVGRSLPEHVNFLMKKCEVALGTADPRRQPLLEQQYKWMLQQSTIWLLEGRSHLIPAEH